MATNQLLPFAAGENPNIIPFDDWNVLPARLSGFLSGIASSQQFNRILAQGGVAGYILGQLIVEQLSQDATLNPDTLYTNWKSAIAKFIPANVADGSINAIKLLDNSIAFAKLASTAIATTEEAKAGTATNKLMTPQLVAQAIAQLAAPLPTGAIVPMLVKSVPAGYLQCDGSQLDHGDAPTLCELLWLFDEFKGDSTSYAVLPDLDGRVLQGVTTIANVGTYLEPQLPNIVGEIKRDTEQLPVGQFLADNNMDELIVTGAFNLTSGSSVSIQNSQAFTGPSGLNIDASRNSTIYNGDKMQVASLQCLCCIKI